MYRLRAHPAGVYPLPAGLYGHVRTSFRACVQSAIMLTAARRILRPKKGRVCAKAVLMSACTCSGV